MLVGRESELRQLAALLDDGRRPLLFGEAGVGKTALARAAAGSVSQRLVEAGALSTLSWLPYLPFRRLLGREPTGDPAYVAEEVERLVRDELLLVDDLHWADRESLEVVSLLAGRVSVIGAVRRGDPGAGPAVEELAASGFELLSLEPLGDEDAATVLATLRPGLARATIDLLVRRSGGNPLLLEELAASGEPTESLRLSVAARLRLLGPSARHALGLLALAGRPLSRSTLGSGATELVEAGLARRAGSRLELRHALVGDAAVTLLEPDERRELHRQLASRTREPGLAARHHAEAGEREAAYRKALRAIERATQPGEVAAHLVVAAANATGPGADDLRLRAAETSVAAGHQHEAVGLLDDLCVETAEVAARTALVRMRAAMADRRFDAAAEELAGAIPLTTRVGGRLEVDAAVADVRLGVERRDPTEHLVPRARRALELARNRGALVGGALHALALALQPLDYASYVATLREALEAARDEDDIALECTIGDTLSRPSIPGAEVVASELVERAKERRLTAWERRFRCRLAGIDFHRGRFRKAYEAGEELLLVALQPWERYLVAYYVAQSAADLGLHDRARGVLDELDRLAVDGHESRRQALWGRTDIELLAGRPVQALAAADALLREFPDDLSTFTRIARSWALWDMGEDPGLPDGLDDGLGFLAGAVPELEGVAALAAAREGDAAELFAVAAERWRGQHVRGELRCLWAAGEALRRAGSAAAVEHLLEAERRALAHDHGPFVARVHRSLRLAGVRRAAPRETATNGLTRREHEILALVARGSTNVEIARRLAIGRPTVDRLVASASAKLGAGSRLQAAALAQAE